MDNKSQIEKVVIARNINDVLTVSSTQIAEHFGKRHTHVLEAIENIKAENSAVTSMFIEAHIKQEQARIINTMSVQGTALHFLQWALQERKLLIGK